jgi:hypothetical protein
MLFLAQLFLFINNLNQVQGLRYHVFFNALLLNKIAITLSVRIFFGHQQTQLSAVEPLP